MPTIDLTDDELQKVMRIISTKEVWSEANPLLMKISQQLQKQYPQQPGMPTNAGGPQPPQDDDAVLQGRRERNH
jgi:hypothetical protein